MKHCKRLLAMVLALGLFSACGAAPAPSAPASSAAASAEAVEATDTPDATAAAVEPSAQEAVSAEPSEAEPEENVVQREECELPLYDGESFTYWTVLQGMDEPNDSFLFWNQLADATGVTIEFVNAPEETAMEKYNLMMATGDCTDVIYERGLTTGTSSSCPYSGGYAKAIADGVYMDLTDAIEENCPNYWSILQENPGVYRDLALDDGTLYCFAAIMDEPYGPNQGAWVRTDMMKQAGVEEIPTTETGWLELWRAMKSADVVQQPTRASNLGDLYPNIAEAYGTTASSNFLIDLESGSVFYDMTSDMYRDYLEYFRQVYSEGIVDPDFYSVSETSMADIDGGLIATYECVLGAANMMTTTKGIEMAAAPAVHLSDYAAAQPKLINYEDWNSRITTGTWCCVSANTEKLDVILDWFNFTYSDYGIQVCNYGFDEGVSYEVLSDGSLQLMPEMLDRDENMVVGRMQYTMKEGPTYEIAKIELPVSSDFIRDSYNTWGDFDKDAAIYSTLPAGVSLSEQENATVSNVMGDIETYVSTVTMQWMTCASELNDETWNEYVTYIKDSGIDDAIAAYQTAYDRYLTK